MVGMIAKSNSANHTQRNIVPSLLPAPRKACVIGAMQELYPALPPTLDFQREPHRMAEGSLALSLGRWSMIEA